MNNFIQEEITLLLANTSFTRAEIHKWHDGFIVFLIHFFFLNELINLYFYSLIFELFKKKDCPKGQLDKKRFVDAYKAFYPQGKADKFCNHVFKVFDFDNSGQIDFTEFLIAISVTAQGDANKKLSMAFKM